MGSKYRFFQNIFKTEVFMTSQQNNDTNTTSEPNWMKEDCVQSIPKEKLHFLQKLVFESSSLSQKELLPFLMALAQKSREASISFSDTGVNLPPSGRFQETFQGSKFADNKNFCDPSVP